jgi:hypothetical protein
MRTVLLGTDFTYTSDGRLVPIEINTNVGMENSYLELDDEIYNLSELSGLTIRNSFTKIIYIGALVKFSGILSEFCNSINIEYEFIQIFNGNITIPYVEDSDNKLIIRSAYDTSAIVDDFYCKNKVNFLNLIKDLPYGSEFAYLDENGVLVNNITNIIDNGDNPNFILKSVLPKYDKLLYPKLYKVNNISELNIILSNVTKDYFLMAYHYNSDKLLNNQVYVIRSLNILFPPNLESFSVGSYKKLTDRKNEELSIFNSETFELEPLYKDKYITSNKIFSSPKLLDTDEVEMADVTFKSGLDLQVGDIVKTIIIPNPNNVDLSNDLANYHISYSEFSSGVTYSTNRVYAKKRVDRVCFYGEILFKDNTSWSDTFASCYLVLRDCAIHNQAEEIQFESIESLVEGDYVVLIDTSTQPEFTSVLKEVSSVSTTKLVFTGWEISVEEQHVFLTRTESITNQSYVAIEHNFSCSQRNNCLTKSCSGKQLCVTGSGGFCTCNYL